MFKRLMGLELSWLAPPSQVPQFNNIIAQFCSHSVLGTFQNMNGPVHFLLSDRPIGFHQRPNIMWAPGKTTPS